MAWTISARPRTAALAVTAGLLLATGCTGSDDAATSPTTAATATASPTAEATDSPTTETPEPTETSALPPLPDAATENTPEGAEAFIRYYFDVANQLYQEPPPAEEIPELVDARLVDPDCISCETLRQELTQLSENGQRTLDDLYTIDSMERIGGGPPDVTRFNMVMTLEDHVIEDVSTGDQTSYTGGQVEGVGAAAWTGTRWVIFDMELG
jgi:hypothetical protein